VVKEGVLKEIDPATLKDSEPIALPPGFEWINIDPDDDEKMEELSQFLNDQYVEEQGGTFRLAFDRQTLQWAYKFPGFNKDYIVAIVNSKSKKILATFMCIISNLQAYDKKIIVAETNFQAVHKKLREKKMG